MSMGFIVSFTLTLLVFSYLLGDNFLYRMAVSAFVGLTAAFTTIAIFSGVIVPLTISSTRQEAFAESLILVIAALITVLLMLKPFPRFKSVSNIGLAFLIAVGTAVALVGAITGTIVPFVADTTAINFGGDLWPMLNGIIILIGVVTSLIYFRYQAIQNPDGTVTHSRVVDVLRNIGKGFIVVTLGAIYATAILTSLTVITGQISSFIN